MTAPEKPDELGKEFTEVEKELILFFRKLAEAQQPLPDDFKQILHDNLWELYAR